MLHVYPMAIQPGVLTSITWQRCLYFLGGGLEFHFLVLIIGEMFASFSIILLFCKVYHYECPCKRSKLKTKSSISEHWADSLMFRTSK